MSRSFVQPVTAGTRLSVPLPPQQSDPAHRHPPGEEWQHASASCLLLPSPSREAPEQAAVCMFATTASSEHREEDQTETWSSVTEITIPTLQEQGHRRAVRGDEDAASSAISTSSRRVQPVTGRPHCGTVTVRKRKG
ncbi:uncharacterized protein LOC144486514 [Mustelus asterias]